MQFVNPRLEPRPQFAVNFDRADPIEANNEGPAEKDHHEGHEEHEGEMAKNKTLDATGE